MITIKALAERLGKHPRTIMRRIDARIIPLPTEREGREIGWTDSVIEKWMRSHYKEGFYVTPQRRHRHRSPRKRVAKAARAAGGKERVHLGRDRDDVSRLLSWGTSRSASIIAQRICDYVDGFRNPRG